MDGAGALEAVIQRLARARRLEVAVRQAMSGLGYQEIAVPLLEPDDGSADWGTAYRVLDGQGAVLALRPDMTVPVARLCALGDREGPRPRRLYYLGTLFRRGGTGTPHELWQAGAERIGGDRPTGDAEILRLVARCLEGAGFGSFLLAVGHMGYLRERLRRAGCGAACVEAVEAALRQRDFVALRRALNGAEEAVADLRWQGDVSSALAGGIATDGAQGRAFAALLGACVRNGVGDRVLVEPGLVLPGHYYTGMVLEVSLPGVALPVGDGGRYDDLLGRWGRSEPAVGFALDCDRLLDAATEDGE